LINVLQTSTNAQQTTVAAAQMPIVTTVQEAIIVHARQDTLETDSLVLVKR
jgi:hypothetical protein